MRIIKEDLIHKLAQARSTFPDTEFGTAVKYGLSIALGTVEAEQEQTCKDVHDDTYCFECSECGLCIEDYLNKVVDDEGKTDYTDYQFRYCPRCGRKVVK